MLVFCLILIVRYDMGKVRKNQRACPAAGRDISSAECGAGRVTYFACSVTCPFNLWRAESYGEVLAVHDRLDAKVFPRLQQDLGKRGLKIAPPSDSAATRQDYFISQLFRRRDDAGYTFFQRWETRGFEGLNNDERVLFQAHARMRVRAIEIQTVRDETLSEAIDLFDAQAGVFLIADRSLAQIAGRFSPFLAWMYELPYYQRMHGLAVPIPAVQGLGSADVVQIVAAHLGWSSGVESLQDWLDRNCALCGEALQAIPGVLWEKTMGEAQTTRSVCHYRRQIEAADFAHVMAKWPDVVPGELDPALRTRGFLQGWDWLETQDRRTPLALADVGAQPIRATIASGDAEVLLIVPVGSTVESVRGEFERRMGARVTFVSERVDELGRQTSVVKSVTPRQRELVPPALLSCARRIQVTMSRVPVGQDIPTDQHALMRAMKRRWIDESLPALDGRTPRQAAADPLHRPTLLALVKDRIRDADLACLNAMDDDDDDFVPDEEDPVALARELGLVELDVPPPPGLYPPPRPQLPPLPAVALTEEQIEQRFEILHVNDSAASGKLLARFDFESDAVCEALDILREDNGDAWPALLDLLLALAWFILFPRETPPQVPSGEELAEAVNEALDRFHEHANAVNPEVIEKILESRRQPVLLTMLRDSLMTATSREFKKARLEFITAVEMAIALRVLIDALDAIARPKA